MLSDWFKVTRKFGSLMLMFFASFSTNDMFLRLDLVINDSVWVAKVNHSAEFGGSWGAVNGSFVLAKLVLWSCLVLSRKIICFQLQQKKKKKKKLQKRSKGTKIICLFHVCPNMDNSSIGPHKKI